MLNYASWINVTQSHQLDAGSTFKKCDTVQYFLLDQTKTNTKTTQLLLFLRSNLSIVNADPFMVLLLLLCSSPPSLSFSSFSVLLHPSPCSVLLFLFCPSSSSQSLSSFSVRLCPFHLSPFLSRTCEMMSVITHYYRVCALSAHSRHTHGAKPSGL